jgi:site-specific DNA recombinase
MPNRNWLGDNRSGLAILRVSSHKQAGGISHETQESDVKKYCESNGIKLLETRRIIESAKNSEDRKQYSAAIKYALANDIRHLLFYMPDREARNLTDNESNETLVRSDLIVIHYVREGKILFKDSPDSDFFVRDVQAAANKQFIRNLTAKTLDAMEHKAEMGWFPSNHVPLGYIVQKPLDEQGRPQKRGSVVVRDPNEKNVQWVKREFELKAEGYSYEQIRNQIVSEGLVASEKISGYRAGHIERRIKNLFYQGRFVWRGKVYEGKHELIIPIHVIAQARNEKRRGRKLIRSDLRGVFGGGWIRCKECGCYIVFDPKKKTTRVGKITDFPYYHCTNGRKLHSSMTGMNVHENRLWQQFDQAVDAIQINPDLAREISDAINDSHKKHVSVARLELERANRDLSDLEKKEDLAFDHMNAGALDQEGYRRQILRIRDDRTRLQRLISSLRSQLSGSFRETSESILELSKNAKTLYLSRSPQERRKFLEMILSNPVLSGLNLEYQMKKPFGVLAEMNRNEGWRPHWDDFRTELASLCVGDSSLV